MILKKTVYMTSSLGETCSTLKFFLIALQQSGILIVKMFEIIMKGHITEMRKDKCLDFINFINNK